MPRERLLRFSYGITMVVAASVVSILVLIGFGAADVRIAFLLISFSVVLTVADFFTRGNEGIDEDASQAYILLSTASLSSSVWIAYHAGFPGVTTSEVPFYSWYASLAISVLSNCWSGWKWVIAEPPVPFCETVKWR